MSADWQFETEAIRSGIYRSSQGEHSEGLYLTSSYLFESAEHAAARFDGSDVGNVYSRYTNPTVEMFEKRFAALAGADKAAACASGMSAILGVAMAHLQQGDQVVISRSIFGTSTSLFLQYMQKFGVSVVQVDLTDLDAWRAAINSSTKLLFAETPSNPLSEVADINELATLAHAVNALLVIDNTFCTPALQSPLKLGADISLYSATKYIDGQGRVLGGVVCGSNELVDPVVGFLRTLGATLSAFNAWVLLKGLETLSLRMQRHCDNALRVATWLNENANVAKVYYAGLEGHEGHQLAVRQQSGFGAVVSFEVYGGKDEAFKVINATKMLSITANLGDAKSTIVHPATTTHGRLTLEQRQQAGISEGLIRLSVGLEAAEDIIADLARGLG